VNKGILFKQKLTQLSLTSQPLFQR